MNARGIVCRVIIKIRFMSTEKFDNPLRAWENIVGQFWFFPA